MFFYLNIKKHTCCTMPFNGAAKLYIKKRFHHFTVSLTAPDHKQ